LIGRSLALLLDFEATRDYSKETLCSLGRRVWKNSNAGKPRRPKSKDVKGEIITEKLSRCGWAARRNQERWQVMASPMSLAFLALIERVSVHDIHASILHLMGF